MRRETNSEMDLLLRRLGRQQEISASSNHLDADELSSYAENVLPPVTRARYTEHLAECARCRNLVVQLSSSAGIVVAPETARVSELSALRKFLASLFSPMVLRFAVPALGLVVVAAIGLMVSRNQEPANSPVAEVRDQQPVQIPLPASQPQPSASPGGESPVLYDSIEANKAATRGNAGTQAGAAPVTNAAPAASADTAADAPKATTERKVEELQPVAKEAPPPQPTPVTNEVKKLEAQGRKQETEKSVAVTAEPPAEKTTDEIRREDRKSQEVAAARAKPLGVASTGSSIQRDGEADKDKNDAETRSVAGRRFRKQGSVWIDTAYRSQSLTELTRGSEHYRGLVGDEPAIKQIADQLGGEIIVVWKSRAYRIR